MVETGQPYAFTGDDPLNATDPLGLYSCAGKSASYRVNKHPYTRGPAKFVLRCGVRERAVTAFGTSKRIQNQRRWAVGTTLRATSASL